MCLLNSLCVRAALGANASVQACLGIRVRAYVQALCRCLRVAFFWHRPWAFPHYLETTAAGSCLGICKAFLEHPVFNDGGCVSCSGAGPSILEALKPRVDSFIFIS